MLPWSLSMSISLEMFSEAILFINMFNIDVFGVVNHSPKSHFHSDDRRILMINTSKPNMLNRGQQQPGGKVGGKKPVSWSMAFTSNRPVLAI